MRSSATSLNSELASDELTLLLTTIKECAFTGKHLEIGTRAGGTLCLMLGALREGNPPIFVVVDPMTHFSHQLDVVKKNVEDHGFNLAKVDFRIKTSNDAFKEALQKNERFDFIFLDGNHKFFHVMQDLRWARLLNPGGRLALHDYSPHFPGVRRAVDQFVRKNINYKVDGKVRDLLILEKRSQSIRQEVSSWDLLRARASTPVIQISRSIRKRWCGTSPQ